MATSAAPRRLDRGDVDLLHPHHRIECALCFIAAGGHRLGQHARRDLPGNAPLVFAPAARAFLPAIADDGVPVAVGLVLIVGGDLEREGFIVFEHGTAVDADTSDAGNGEVDRQHITGLAGWVVAGCTHDGAHDAVGKGLGVEAGGCLRVLIVPEANRVLGHCESFRFEAPPRPVPAPLAIGIGSPSMISSLMLRFASQRLFSGSDSPQQATIAGFKSMAAHISERPACGIAAYYGGAPSYRVLDSSPGFCDRSVRGWECVVWKTRLTSKSKSWFMRPSKNRGSLSAPTRYLLMAALKNCAVNYPSA